MYLALPGWDLVESASVLPLLLALAPLGTAAWMRKNHGSARPRSGTQSKARFLTGAVTTTRLADADAHHSSESSISIILANYYLRHFMIQTSERAELKNHSNNDYVRYARPWANP